MSMPFRHTQLDNGLTIVAEVNATAHTAAAGFFVKTGARDEPHERMGVSHFLEHMMFKGTERRTAEQVNLEFDRIGADYNASTSQEATCYFARVLPEKLADALDLLGDILRPSLREDDFTMEKNVILEEIGMYQDRPFWVAYEQAMENHFVDHPLSHRVLGTEQSINALTRAQMLEYFQQRYSPDNMVVALSGRLDFERCVDQLAALCGRWQSTGAARRYPEPAGTSHEQTITKPGVTMHYTLGLSPAPSAQDELRYAAAVLSHVVGDCDGSRLYWALIDPGLADEADLTHHGFDHTGLYMSYACCPPANAERVGRIMAEVLSGIGDDLTVDEVKRAVNKIAMQLTMQHEQPLGRMMALGAKWLYLGEYYAMEQELAKVRAVDVDQLRALLKRYPLAVQTLVRLQP